MLVGIQLCSFSDARIGHHFVMGFLSELERFRHVIAGHRELS